MPTTGLSAECSAELQGVRGKMLKMRAEVDAALDKADSISKTLVETTEKLHTTEEERNALQRQATNINDQLYTVEEHLKVANSRLAECEDNKELLSNEVKALNHRLNTMDAAEEVYKRQLGAERDRGAQLETESAEHRRNVARLQMDNEKLDHDVDMLRSDNVLLAQQLKEAEDRIAELTSSYNQIVMENRQLEHNRINGRHHHEVRSIHAPSVQQTSTAVPSQQQQSAQDVHRQRQLEASVKDLDEAHMQLNKRDAKISQLENEVFVYQENYRMLSDQLREVEQVNKELKQQQGSGFMNRANTATDQLTDAIEQNKTLNAQLSDSEKQNAVWEAKAVDMTSQIGKLEQQLQEQKAAYGELYSQMNRTIKDLEKGNEAICDF